MRKAMVFAALAMLVIPLSASAQGLGLFRPRQRTVTYYSYPGYSYSAYYSYPGYSYSAYSYPTYYSYPGYSYSAYSYPTYYSPAYSYSTVMYLPSYPIVCVEPQPQTGAPPLAQPTAAPPSAGPVDAWTAPAPKSPQVKESQSYYSATAVARRDSETPASAEVPVAFWNRTGRTVALNIDGQNRVLSAGKGVTMDLPRRFVWQADGRASQTERVPADVPAYEIVIRQ